MAAHRPPRRKAAPKTTSSAGLKVRIRGRDDAPLSIAQLQQGLYELARKLDPYAADYRAKRSTLYLTIVDQNGSEVSLSVSGEWSIWPYRSAADELDERAGAAALDGPVHPSGKDSGS
jgi:hypothetical protein